MYSASRIGALDIAFSILAEVQDSGQECTHW